MQIDKLRVKNFKKFQDKSFDFNDDLNILVGDNDSGKSTILESLEVALNCSYRGKPLASELSIDLFNLESVKKFIGSDKSPKELPQISIELFLSGVPEYRGANNSLGLDKEGLSIYIKFDDDLLPAYEEFLKQPENIKSIPVEFYKVEWMDFSWKKIKYLTKKVHGLFVDPTRLHPTYGKNLYISKIISSSLPKDQQALLNMNYRQLKELFNKQPQVQEVNHNLDDANIVTEKSLDIVADVSTKGNATSGLQLAVDKVNFPLIGKGEQNKIQIKLAIQNKAKNIDVIMLEEPENHLSHMNLSKLVKYIEEQKGDKQLFISTHSSFVLNKLSLSKLCFVAEDYIRLNDLDDKVSKRLKRLPGYDTLRAVLADKVILVEGPSDELILKKIYLEKHNKLPEEDGIDIVVVRGIGFLNYLEICKYIGTQVHVVKDNDGDYKKNISDYAEPYKDVETIKFFSSTNDKLYSLEPVLIEANAGKEESLDSYAEISLSTQTYNKYKAVRKYKDKVTFLQQWYQGEDGAGKKKVDSAMRIFESKKSIEYPEYFMSVLDFD